jgi:hypothetical protein
MSACSASVWAASPRRDQFPPGTHARGRVGHFRHQPGRFPISVTPAGRNVSPSRQGGIRIGAIRCRDDRRAPLPRKHMAITNQVKYPVLHRPRPGFPAPSGRPRAGPGSGTHTRTLAAVGGRRCVSSPRPAHPPSSAGPPCRWPRSRIRDRAKPVEPRPRRTMSPLPCPNPLSCPKRKAGVCTAPAARPGQRRAGQLLGAASCSPG